MKNKTNGSITVNGNNYFINTVPEQYRKKPEWFLAGENINVFFAKNLGLEDEPAAAMRSWFPKKQPSESEVRSAMIWSYDQFGDYQIKSGGGAVSDSIFISQLMITTSDAATGSDKNVILLKKYSRSFEKVLISIKEIEDLDKASASLARKNNLRLNMLPSLLRELIVWEKGIRRGGFQQKHICQMIREARDNYSRQEIETGLKALSSYARAFEQRSLIGGTGQNFLNYIACLISEFENSKFEPFILHNTSTHPEAALRSHPDFALNTKQTLQNSLF